MLAFGSRIDPDQDGFFDSNSYSIHYKVWGKTGKPIILVHGWGSDISGNWERTGWIKSLQPHRRVVALDVLGHGNSDKPHVQSAYSYFTLAEDVLNLMDHLDIKTTDLLGYSMGAFIGEALLIRHQNRFASMILAGIGDEVDHATEEAAMIAAALREADPDKIEDPLGKAIRFFADSSGNNDNEALALAALQMWPESFPLVLGGTGLASVSIPVLIINGADDYYAETADKFAAAIPRAQLQTVPGKDHSSVVDDEQFRQAVIDFLSDQNTR